MSAWFSPICAALHDTTTTELQIATIFYHRDGFLRRGVSTCLRRIQLLSLDVPQHLKTCLRGRSRRRRPETMTLSQNIFHASD